MQGFFVTAICTNSMNSKIIRQKFKDFFASHGHQIVSSAPMVIKDDPTLLFTNAGMNQFKDFFLGTQQPTYPRVANSQKCLRVSGKHNDLEEVGHDTYHHTMFEMLGNWSFGDYFKAEAIQLAWEFLVDTVGLAPDRLYTTIFEGDAEELIPRDDESYQLWLRYLDKSRILEGSKKDNFWEMGESGPCGPCSEIHIDLRSEEERMQVPGSKLVNTGHPLVIEIWNLVFIQFNRKSDGSLEQLPQKHVDTGMGFERLCMALQGKKSNYDTDLFQTLISAIAAITEKSYGIDPQIDIAMRVIADHIRAIAFSIADGQLPSNNGAGYVIRRILRRAVRYAFTFLDKREPFMSGLIPVLANEMGEAFPELTAQQNLIATVITEEETSFLRTLDLGIHRLDQIMADQQPNTPVSGKAAFELYDTFGFPLDLTQLILSEKGLNVDIQGFNTYMEEQKSRSRQASGQETADWVILHEGENPVFVGYDQLTAEIRLTRYRQVKSKKSSYYQLVFDRTPFYAESGGQVGDTGTISDSHETIQITDTRKENNLIVHLASQLPKNPQATFFAQVKEGKRLDTMRNHTATHLLHHALRKVLGQHVEQKGSLVHPDYLRFDFSHYQKMTEDEILKVETIVNQLIRENISLTEIRDLPMDQARKMGAMALFGEKYGDRVRVIRFGDSIELCGGTHVSATGQIGLFRLTSESSIAAGIRRIEALTGFRAENEARENARLIQELSGFLKTGKGLVESVLMMQEEVTQLRKKIEGFAKEQQKSIKRDLSGRVKELPGVQVICERVELDDPALVKDLAYQLRGEMENLYLVLGTLINGKPNLSVMISDELVKKLGLNAGAIVRESAREMEGGGGGQPFFATAGGKNPAGLDKAMAKAVELLGEKLK